MRNRNTPHQQGAGRGQDRQLLSHSYYTPADASRQLIACLLQGIYTYAHEPQQLCALLITVNETLHDALLEQPYQAILDGLQEALHENRPLDSALLHHLATQAGMDYGQLLQLAEEKAAPSHATYYAEQLRNARLYQSIRAKASQLYNQPDALPELLPELNVLVQQLAGVGRNRLPIVLGHSRERETAHAIVPNLLYAERITFLAGEAGVGKTTFALEIADALTRTGKLWNDTVEVQPARVLWLDFDHSWERLQEILDAYYGEHAREIYTVPREHLQPLDAMTLTAYRRAIEHFGIDLIIADTAFDWLAVKDSNDETEARAKLQLVHELITSTGCGVLLHHLRKSGEGPPVPMPYRAYTAGQPKWTRLPSCIVPIGTGRISCDSRLPKTATGRDAKWSF